MVFIRCYVTVKHLVFSVYFLGLVNIDVLELGRKCESIFFLTQLLEKSNRSGENLNCSLF